MDKETFYTGILLYIDVEVSKAEDLRTPLVQALKVAAESSIKLSWISPDVADDPIRQTHFLEEIVLYGMSSRLLLLESTWEDIKMKKLDNAARERLKTAVGHQQFFIKSLTFIGGNDIGHSNR